ncbi:Vacuolar protein sorting-associated protein 9A [Zea mays]|uniref:Vacuolar protein sorting-associated protein 9A n=1 Tax=Zea mays TaxID=4577 RepID=A0A1D6PBY1_MAIZE|nr:Vacuolar protein sorting-associated protein 9A [Zea mays]
MDVDSRMATESDSDACGGSGSGSETPTASPSPSVGLEKYVMTKLFDRTFGTSTEDVVSDMDISEKIGLLQQFVKPRHLDIPKVQHNEALWLVLDSLSWTQKLKAWLQGKSSSCINNTLISL